MATKNAANAVVRKSAIFTRRTGTPTARAASGAPPVPKIQLPDRVRTRIHVAIAVRRIHHRIEMLKRAPMISNSLPNHFSNRANPGTSSRLPSCVRFVRARVIAVVRPRKMNSVPSVMMNDGSFVRTTSHPLMKPVVNASTSARIVAGQQRPAQAARIHRCHGDHDRHPRETEDRTDRQVELARDHQQGDGHREDPEGGRPVEDRGGRRHPDEVVVRGDDREEDPDDDQPGDRAELGPAEEPGERPDPADAFVRVGGGLGCRGCHPWSPSQLGLVWMGR